MAFVIAPAGFGKSTILCQWANRLTRKNRKCGWLNLDQNDQDSHQFLA